jgi:hypothetical protein
VAALSACSVLLTIAVTTSDNNSTEDIKQITAHEGNDQGDIIPHPSIKGEQLGYKPVLDAERNEICDNGCKVVQPKRKRTSARHVQMRTSPTFSGIFHRVLAINVYRVESG